MSGTNHLKGQTSPYLMQHVHNPVDWYPWGEEALAKARKENKPLLVSIGYSACHWCHVMEREVDGGELPVFAQRFVPGKTMIYVCGMGYCKLPVETVKEALAQLQ